MKRKMALRFEKVCSKREKGRKMECSCLLFEGKARARVREKIGESGR